MGWIVLTQKHCFPDSDAEIAGEVNEAYGFYRQCITAANRKAGGRAINLLREVYSERSSTVQGSRLERANASPAHPPLAPPRQTVLKVG